MRSHLSNAQSHKANDLRSDSDHKDVGYRLTTGQDQLIVLNLDGDRGGWPLVHGHLFNPGDSLARQEDVDRTREV